MKELCAVGHSIEVSAHMVELMREDEEENKEGEGMREGRGKVFSSTDDLVPR